MQNSLIWKSIEALCDEAESVIKSGDDLMAVIQSTAPPAPAIQRNRITNDVSVLSSKPAPPRANTIDKVDQHKNSKEAPLSPATMSEIAAAIEHASQSAQKREKIDQPSQTMSNQLKQDLIAEVSQTVQNVLADKLPQMIQHAISESLSEIITKSVNQDFKKIESPTTKATQKNKDEKVLTKKKAVHAKTVKKRVKAKNISNKTDM